MSIASEEYREIKGFRNYYEISNFGNIRSLDRYVKHEKGGLKLIKGKNLKTHINKKTGYVVANLFMNGKQHSFLIHRLVARAFPEICGEWFDNCEIDHKDTCRTNNYADNLKVCTRKENHLNPITRVHYKKCAEHFKRQNAWNKGLKFPEKTGKNHFNAKPILQYDINGILLNKYDTIKIASDKTGIIRSSIDNCLNNRAKTAGGYIWKYVKEGDYIVN